MKEQKSHGPSKRLSWLLRHGAHETGIAMDAAGWCAIDEVRRVLGITRAALDEAVAENTKSRLEIAGERIRASQGHSREGMPVTREALEASWQRVEPVGSTWHGTDPEAACSIASEGIHAARRTHVHLAQTYDSHVGKRAGVGVMLEVSLPRLADAGLTVFVSGNGVVLVREVPREAIVGVVPVTARGRSVEAEIRSRLGLTPSPQDAVVPARPPLRDGRGPV